MLCSNLFFSSIFRLDCDRKYLEAYGSDGAFQGRNSVFDGGGAAAAEETRLGGRDSSQSAGTATENNAVIVGQCVSCRAPYDCLNSQCVCTVCREPTLVCKKCQTTEKEYHCKQHSHLREGSFPNLDQLSVTELQERLHCLRVEWGVISIGRRFKQKRKTLQKQIGKVYDTLEGLECESECTQTTGATELECRSCGEPGCKRKEALERKEASPDTTKEGALSPALPSSNKPSYRREPLVRKQQSAKKEKRDRFIEEAKQLGLAGPASACRDPETGVRIPPCCTRVLRCNVKARWCGRPVVDVMKQEFADLSRPEVLRDVIQKRLLLISGKPIPTLDTAQILKSADVVTRVLHWHEAPVIVPGTIDVQKVELPESIIQEYSLSEGDSIYVCNKPSSVPVHPAGPYLSNSLTMMVAAQEGIEHQSLLPLHRTDRVTSGLTLCGTSSTVSRLFQMCLLEGHVEKLYIARVAGRFVSDESSMTHDLCNMQVGSFSWHQDTQSVVVDSPIAAVYPAKGARAATANGKPSRSIFKLLHYNEEDTTSVLSCIPVTGRNHQLRVHLQQIGFPIIGDTHYGGDPLVSDVNTTEYMHRVWKEHAKDEKRLPELTQSDCEVAKEACSYCKNGVEGIADSFTPAQLLQGGHEIQLHALRYQINVPSKKENRSTDSECQPLAIIKLQVAPPPWAQTDAVAIALEK
jgi:23S rRNA-/tRNA-specific pseudouridylate synthase